jgi:uncharacterized protein (TIGR01777 family)
MKILVSGASGLVGTKLTAALTAAGYQVGRLVRDRSRAAGSDVVWNPAEGQLETSALADCDAVINLAGENIASGRWSAKRKERILHSRVNGTRTITTALAAVADRPRTLINASAVGFYGDRGDEILNEASSSGSGDFLSGVCRDWENATEPAAKAGVRVVLARFGVILSSQGGALKKMLLPFRLGLGGKIGSGRQYMSWVAIDDVIGATLFCLGSPAVHGPVNVVAPQPVTNAEFTKTLGRAIGRPAIFPMPAMAARLAFGQMADELLLASQRVEPTKLLDAGYAFKYPNLEPALVHVLGRG